MAQGPGNDGGVDEFVDRLRRELGEDAANVPPPPPPARPPTRLGRARARASVATWRVRGAIPEPMKTPLRRLAGRPAPALGGQPAEPSDLARTVEELQLLQLELAHRVSELEERLAASGGGEKAKAKPRSTKR